MYEDSIESSGLPCYSRLTILVLGVMVLGLVLELGDAAVVVANLAQDVVNFVLQSTEQAHVLSCLLLQRADRIVQIIITKSSAARSGNLSDDLSSDDGLSWGSGGGRISILRLLRLCNILAGVWLGLIWNKLAFAALRLIAVSGANVPLDDLLDSVGGAWLAGQQLIDERLVVALLPGEVLDRDLQLVKRVLHVEQVVEVEREVHGGLLFVDLRVALLFGDCLHSLLG